MHEPTPAVAGVLPEPVPDQQRHLHRHQRAGGPGPGPGGLDGHLARDRLCIGLGDGRDAGVLDAGELGPAAVLPVRPVWRDGGLCLGRVCGVHAQLLAVASGVIYLPFEVFELVQGASVLGVLVLLANLLIVFGMAYSLVYRKAKIAK